MYLLDTNVVSELRRQRPHPAVEEWIRPIPAEKLLLSAVTVGEIQAGIEITREQDRSKAKELEVWLDQVTASYQILFLDAPVMREWARLMHRKSDTLIQDALIDCRNRRSPPFDRGNPECPGFRTVRRRDTQSISSSGIAVAPAKVSGRGIAALSGDDAGTGGRRSPHRPRFRWIGTTRPRCASRSGADQRSAFQAVPALLRGRRFALLRPCGPRGAGLKTGVPSPSRHPSDRGPAVLCSPALCW